MKQINTKEKNNLLEGEWFSVGLWFCCGIELSDSYTQVQVSGLWRLRILILGSACVLILPLLG